LGIPQGGALPFGGDADSRRGDAAPVQGWSEHLGTRPVSTLLADCLTLTKPGITVMVLITTLIGYLIGAPPRLAGLLPLIHVLFGTALLVMGGGCMNMVLEAGPDGRMLRTRDRPIPSGRVSILAASFFGIGLTLAGGLHLWRFSGELAAFLGALSWVLYVLVYTGLKPFTTLSTIIGAVPGAMPPLIGYAAAAGRLDMAGMLLFFIMFLWQFPHFLAIGWMYRDDYARGGLQVLAVADPSGVLTSRQGILYALALVPVSMLPSLFGVTGPVYAVAAFVLSFLYLRAAWRCQPARLDAEARPLFFTSILYLPALLAVLVLDHLFL